MTILILCNIGNSDLIADGQRPSRPRPEGQQLWDEFTAHRFELPIITPCLEYIRNRYSNEPARLICFYTDQPERPGTTRPDRFGVSLRDKDTIWFAHIAARLVREQFTDWIVEARPERIEGSQGADLNPSIYDEVFEAYAGLVARHNKPEVSTCYVLTAGGIPACNFALQLQASIAFAERCRFVYPPEGGRVTELRIGEKLQESFQRVNAMEALKHRNFPAALLSVRSAKMSEAIIHLLEYAVYREAFDFHRAQHTIALAERWASGELRDLCATLHDDLLPLINNKDAAALLREVAYSAEIAARNGRYADMLGRIFRFQEGVLRFVVERYLGLPTDMSKAVREANLASYLAQIDGNPHLHQYLEQKTIDNQPLRYRDGPNRPVMQAMLEFVSNGGLRADGPPFAHKKERERLAGVKALLDRLDRLAELRNQSVIAHGFAGVSQDTINEVYEGGVDKIIDDLRRVLYLLDIQQLQSPFELIADNVSKVLQRGV
ncbi:hypothetical protein [Chloroflexus aggregans]|uniref:Uncharacterized protein n=1 Tax=Chloroflexus aggregans (strain MD-66 / DSM 9485) TaxID=326427 RepID=B8G915_CHLAD|nr:hypothetical protein [Chloroflexus aggregans]ACL26290.1 conserved hypothetical protein [Chloroflexus aggregans DSM 9485]